MAKYHDDRDFRDEPIEWRELRDFVVDQVKRMGPPAFLGIVKPGILELKRGASDPIKARLHPSVAAAIWRPAKGFAKLVLAELKSS